jgi:hypothetical protein
MFLNFVIIVIYSFVYVIVGSILLALVPAFRVTMLNLVVFVLGAFAGNFAVLYTTNIQVLDFLMKGFYGFFVLYFVAAIFGGTVAVWLKKRLLNTPADSRLL